MIISEKQQQANQQNAQKSTGPTTPEGKNAVRFNALTYGLRTRVTEARALPREVLRDGRQVRVKRVRRPAGTTAKAESDDLAATKTHAARQRARREAEDDDE